MHSFCTFSLLCKKTLVILLKIKSMNVLIRIPMQAWAVKFYLYQNRHKLDRDGVTIHQTAKDKIGKMITSYMRKTIFDLWYMGKVDESHLRVYLPGSYARHGLTKEDIRNIGDMMEDEARDRICLMVASMAANPGISRSLAIRKVLELMDISEDDYDLSHFRRYFDRYGANSFGTDFLNFRKEITRTLKQIYDAGYVEYMEKVV